MKITKTLRGFELIEFVDHNGERCVLQQSSLAIFTRPGSSAVLLGVSGIKMHLDLKQVKALLKHLNQWVETGSFKVPRKTGKGEG
jgi:hypothetical protein